MAESSDGSPEDSIVRLGGGEAIFCQKLAQLLIHGVIEKTETRTHMSGKGLTRHGCRIG